MKALWTSLFESDAFLKGVKLFQKHSVASGEKQFAFPDEAFTVEKKYFGRKKSARLDGVFVVEK